MPARWQGIRIEKTMGRKPLLVLDDEPEIRELIKMALGMLGYEVRAVANGVEGLKALETMHTPGLIILDLMMPVMDGIEFAKRLRRNPEHAKIPLIVISAYGHRAQEIPDLVEVFDKPMDFDLLKKMAIKYCGPKAPDSPQNAPPTQTQP